VNGLGSSLLTITEPALLHIATRYTREAGVRNLERAIGGVVRYKAVEWAEHLDSQSEKDSAAAFLNKEGDVVASWRGSRRLMRML
jgi:ATP-dependent Lon protease